MQPPPKVHVIIPFSIVLNGNLGIGSNTTEGVVQNTSIEKSKHQHNTDICNPDTQKDVLMQWNYNFNGLSYVLETKLESDRSICPFGI